MISNLLLVPVGSFYRPALRIAEHPELAAAFARGEEMRAAGPVDPGEAHMEWLLTLPRDARTAYSLGFGGTRALRAPAPAAVVVPLLLAEAVAQSLLRESRSRPMKVAIAVTMTAVAMCAAPLTDRAQQRRAEKLGLTPETAPVPAPFGATFAQLLARGLLIGIQQLRSRRATGRWPRVDAGSTIAAAAIRELQRRRDWNAAYRQQTEPDSASEPCE